MFDDLEKMAKLCFFGDAQKMLNEWGDLTKGNSSTTQAVQTNLVHQSRDRYNRRGVGIQVSNKHFDYDATLPSWTPDDDGWVDRGKLLLQQFLKDQTTVQNLPQLRGQPVRGQQASLYKFEMDHQEWDVDYDGMCITVPLIQQPRDPAGLVASGSTSMPMSFQTGGIVPEEIVLSTMYHGTRDKLARLIVHHGLRSSARSHHVVGTWLTTDKAFALNWGVTPMDIFPGCAVHVLADDASLRRNVDIGENKAVAEAPARGELSEILILKAVTFRIPSEAWNKYREDLDEAVKADIKTHNHWDACGLSQLHKEFMDLFMHRYSCFSCSTQEGQWGRLNSHKIQMHNLARIVLQVVRPLALQSKENRFSQLALIKCAALPPALGAFFLKMHGANFKRLFAADNAIWYDFSVPEIWVTGFKKRSEEEPSAELTQYIREFAARGRTIGSAEVYNSSQSHPGASGSQETPEAGAGELSEAEGEQDTAEAQENSLSAFARLRANKRRALPDR